MEVLEESSLNETREIFDLEHAEHIAVGLDLAFYKLLNLNTYTEHLREAK